mgnify:CR=1 FL=1
MNIEKIKAAALDCIKHGYPTLSFKTEAVLELIARLEAAEANQILSASARQFKQMEEQLTVARENLSDILRKNDSLNTKLEAAERDAERWKTFESVAKDLVFHRNEKGDASRDYWYFGPNQSGLQYIYRSVETAMDTLIKYREAMKENP